jgi:hypothetical protein
MKYYAGKKQCGCVVFACVDDPDDKDDVAEWIADAIKDGLTIEHVESDEGPRLQTCKCGQTADLFGG